MARRLAAVAPAGPAPTIVTKPSETPIKHRFCYSFQPLCWLAGAGKLDAGGSTPDQKSNSGVGRGRALFTFCCHGRRFAGPKGPFASCCAQSHRASPDGDAGAIVRASGQSASRAAAPAASADVAEERPARDRVEQPRRGHPEQRLAGQRGDSSGHAGASASRPPRSGTSPAPESRRVCAPLSAGAACRRVTLESNAIARRAPSALYSGNHTYGLLLRGC